MLISGIQISHESKTEERSRVILHIYLKKTAHKNTITIEQKIRDGKKKIKEEKSRLEKKWKMFVRVYGFEVVVVLCDCELLN